MYYVRNFYKYQILIKPFKLNEDLKNKRGTQAKSDENNIDPNSALDLKKYF